MTIGLGKKFLLQKNYKDAEKIFLDLNKKNNNFETNYNLGVINFELKKIKQSLKYFEKCKKIDPRSLNTYLKIAYLEQSRGDIEKSLSTYQKVLEINIKDIRAYYGIFTLNPNFLKESHFQVIKEINESPKANVLEKFLSEFLMSKKEKNEGNFDKELIFLNNAHTLCFDFKKEYNLQSQKYYSQIILEHYNQSNFIDNDKKNHLFDNISPIFIIGLPRSGSTLVEAIITSSEDKIPSFGESAFINMGIINQLSSKILSNNEIKETFNFKVNELQDFVNKKYSQFSLIENKTNNFVDKSLENFFNIEIILNFFPNAKFIHTYRNYDDAIIAIYQTMLPKLSWSHSIADIKEYISLYKKTIKYFKKKYPDKIIDVELSKLTKSKEIEIKKILNFCKIEINKNFLDFDKNEEESPKLFSEDTDINNNEHSHDESKIEPEIEKDLSNVSFDDKDDLEIPAFLRRQTN